MGCNGARIQYYYFTSRVNLIFSSAFNQSRDRYSGKMAELFGDWLKDEPKVIAFRDAMVQESKIIATAKCYVQIAYRGVLSFTNKF